MSFTTTAKLGAGTKLYFENPAVPGEFKLLDNALLIGQVGEQGEFVETTPISKNTREYVRGLKTPPEKQLTFNHIPGDTSYAEFLGVWDNETTVDQINVRIDYPTNDRVEIVMVPNGRVMEEAQGGAQLQMICFAQQSGSALWSEI